MRTCAILCLLVTVIAVSAEPVLTTQVVKTGLTHPVYVCAPPGDTARLFVVEQHSGSIKIIHLADGSVSTFMTVSGVLQGSEQGLLGLAFHPQYATNGFFFVNYTASGGGAAGHTSIDRFHATDAETGDPASRTPILSYDQPESNHNGGWLGFGADGFLYISSGDGGGGNDQHGTIGNAQDLTSLLGKILRIDVDSASPYSIPASNPFFGDTSKRGEIYAFGVRNPWRCSFDRASGNLWIGDVGQGAREEIDFIANGTAGKNFGWRPREGNIATSGISETPITAATDPVYDYPHANSNNCVIGGCIYRGTAIPGLESTYFFSDYGGRHFFSFRSDGTSVTAFTDRTAEFGGSNLGVTSYGEDAAGEIYMCDYANSSILKIVDAAAANHAPAFVSAAAATPNPAATGATVAFTADATDADADQLTYTWDFGDGNSATGAAQSKAYATAGLYTVSVTVSDGRDSVVQTINLVVQDQPQTGTFILTRANLTFNFVKANTDSFALSGQLPLPVDFNPSGKTVRLVMGSLDRSFMLDSKGTSFDKALHLRKQKSALAAKFTLTIRRDALFDAMAVMGLTKTQDNPAMDFSVIVILDGQSYLAHRVMNYRVRTGRFGPQSARAR